jgi:metallophosphoesterase (TIGR00282 family)
MSGTIRVVALGDLVGRSGRTAVARTMRRIRDEHEPDLVAANVENAAGGFGITPEVYEEIVSTGVDVCTSGNHIFDKREGWPLLDETERLLRPANYPASAPGHGVVVIGIRDVSVAVINLQGRTFMPDTDCPFATAERVLSELPEDIRVVLCDFHAEATSEKQALARYLDGRVSVVWGTHTHVQTADEQVLPGGTGYITDIGLSGGHAGVLGMEPDEPILRFLTGLNHRFRVTGGQPRVQGARFDVDAETGRCVGVKRIDMPVEG